MPYRALVWLLARVSAHMHHQHVLGLEGPQLPGATSPVAHELLPLPVDVLTVDVLERKTKRLSTVPDSTQTLNILLPALYSAPPLGGVGVGNAVRPRLRSSSFLEQTLWASVCRTEHAISDLPFTRSQSSI